jgi:uncharacterized membrane protein (DUF485 family)
MDHKQNMEEFRRNTDWTKIYNSEVFKTLKANRMRFVIPAIVGVFLVFSFLWTTQSYIPALANLQVIGYINFSFLFTMILFPVIWLAGFWYTKYAEKNVEPHERELLETYGQREEDK